MSGAEYFAMIFTEGVAGKFEGGEFSGGEVSGGKLIFIAPDAAEGLALKYENPFGQETYLALQ